MQKVVITGSNGLLGQTLVNLLEQHDGKYEVHALSRGEDRNMTGKNYNYHDIDLVDFNEVEKILRKIAPEFIVNTAAMTHVDVCEDNKELCDEINVTLVAHLAAVAEDLGSHLIHISTDFIFDGEAGTYTESDMPNPVNYYGLSKLRSEEVLLNSQADYTILRTILVYGYVKGMSRNNIVLWIRDQVKNKQEVTIIDDQFRMPTLVDDLAEACLLAIEKRAKGVFNVSSSELMSIYDIALEVANVFDLDKSYIKRVSTAELNQRAPRPVKTGFDLTKSKDRLELPIYTFKERLQYFKNQLNKSD